MAGSPTRDSGARGADWQRLLFQRNPDTKAVENRVHLDLNVGLDERDVEVKRLRQLGAATLYEIDEPGGHHVTMTDSEGNGFCAQ